LRGVRADDFVFFFKMLQVRQDIDHRSYMPAAWRVDEYLNDDEEEEDPDIGSLRGHK
jgi:peptidyl-prolyl cis-trans isomerase SDCCAG10